MRLNKFTASISLVVALTALAAAQNARLSVHLRAYDGDFTSVTSLSALATGAPQNLTFDISDIPVGGKPVQVTVRLISTHNTTNALGISIINSYFNLRGSGLTVGEFDEDEGGNNSDDRKNVNSHPRGNSAIDGGGNGTYRDNSVRWYQPNAPGALIQGPAVFGKSIYTTPFLGTTSQALYSFVVIVPQQLGTYNVAFSRVFSGNPANTDPTAKTNILANTPQGRPYQYELEVLNGSITVVPEPASMIALGSGLVGLLALRRRKK